MLSAFPHFERITLDSGPVEHIDKLLELQRTRLTPFFYDGPCRTLGRWSIQKFTVPKYSLGAIRHVRDGGRGMAPGSYHRLVRTNDDGTKTLVMSDTPAEMIDFLASDLRHAHGRILIAGLGMGLAVKALLMLRNVSHIDVVEIDHELISLVGPQFAGDARVTIHEHDIFTYTIPRGTTYAWAWYDIWDTIDDDNLVEMKRLRKRFVRNVAAVSPGQRTRQVCWAEAECRKMKARIDPRHW